MRRRKQILRWTLGIATLLVVVALIVAGRPALHLLRVSASDRDKLPPAPAGHVDDASRQNLTQVHEVVEVADDYVGGEAQLKQLLQRARDEGLRVSIAGSRHTMGGHTIYPGGIAIDMTTFDGFELDESKYVLHTQAGATWAQIIAYLDTHGRSVAIMQSNNSFTVGGSISANCHGWPPNHPPIASTVRSFRLMRADGSIVRCSRGENAELFSLVLGGYGLFGIILDVDLDVVPNESYEIDRQVIAADALPEVFHEQVLRRADAAMAYARLRVTEERFLEDAVLNVYRRHERSATDIPELGATALPAVKRSVFRGSAGSEYGKRLRWNAEVALSDRLAEQYASRNQLLNDPVDLYQDRSEDTVDILHEYFVPPQRFGAFLSAMRAIIPKHHGDLLNVTVRHVAEDHDTFLRYADREMYALVLLFCQQRTEEGDAQMQAMTRDLIDAALQLGGRYYLPYRLHATVEQFDAAYPPGRQFFELKRKYDPQELFQNEFYVKYGRGGNVAPKSDD